MSRRRPLLARPLRSEWDQPRPQFGFLPWFAFFFLDSFRFVVRFDTAGDLNNTAGVPRRAALCRRQRH